MISYAMAQEAQGYGPNNPGHDQLKIFKIPYFIAHHYWKKKARHKYLRDLDQRSESLCWACTAYFDFDKVGFHPPYQTKSDWTAKNKFGNIDVISKRAQDCVCCTFITQMGEKLRIEKETDLTIETTARGFQLSYDQGDINPSYLINIHDNMCAKDVHMVEAETMNLRVVKSWFDNCQREHGSVCKGDWASVWRHDRPDMRVVDVQQMVLLWPAPQNCEYVVLSYVWGGAEKIRINNSARHQIDLNPLHHKLPQTIKDAITVTKKMGLKYLWVDNLCIQARFNGRSEVACEEDRNKQFSNMHKIYGMAQFCIVAAQGESANAGLWPNPCVTQEDGAITPRRACFVDPNQIRINEDTTLVLSTRLPADIKKSMWTQRAWCLQEQLFSVRYLVFYDDQVWYQCKKGMWFEDTPLELKTEFIAHDHAQQKSQDESATEHRWRTRQSDSKFTVACRITEIKVDMPGLYTAMALREEREEEVVQSEGSMLVVRSDVFKEYQSIVALYTQRSMSNASDALRAANGLLSVIQDIMGTEMLSGLPESMLDAALLWRGKESLHARQDYSPELHESIPSWSWAGWEGRVTFQPIVERRRPVVGESSNKQNNSLENLRPFLRWFKVGDMSGDGEEYRLRLVNGTGTGIWCHGHRPKDWQRATKLPDFEPAYHEYPKPLKTQLHHLHAWTLQSSTFWLENLKSSSQYKYISSSNVNSEDYVGELWLDDWSLPSSQIHRMALIVISEAQTFDDRFLNHEFEVYNYPDHFLLYNVLLVDFVRGVALRKGIGRVSKRGWGLMKPHWECLQLA